MSDVSKGLVLEDNIPENIFANITGMSPYAFEYQLNGGYIPLKFGYRVGVSGEISYTREGKAVFGKINSLCIRVSQNRMLYDTNVFKTLYDDRIYNTCVISPSGCGKTTFLKNFAAHINTVRPDIHMCIADERGELSISGLKNSSVMSNCNKSKAVEYFVRCMNPGLIMFDELWGEDDFVSVRNAMMSGIPVVFSIHGTDEENTVYHQHYDKLKSLIKRNVILSKKSGPGTLEVIKRC